MFFQKKTHLWGGNKSYLRKINVNFFYYKYKIVFLYVFSKKRLIYGEETSHFYEKEMKTFLLIRENNVFFYIFVFFFIKRVI